MSFLNVPILARLETSSKNSVGAYACGMLESKGTRACVVGQALTRESAQLEFLYGCARGILSLLR